MIPYDKPVRVLRAGDDGQLRRTDTMAHVGNKMLFSITADVEDGDLVEYELPNGNTRTIRLINVRHHEAPSIAPRDADHISAEFTPASLPQPVAAPRFDLPGLHPRISGAAGSLFQSGHYRQAVFDALQAVEHRVQTLTGRSESGRDLMGKVFGSASPQLDVTKAAGRNAEDERGGFAQLFMGVMLGVRNPRGHGSAVQDSAEEALEYLALASLLMRRLDLAESRLP
ncbi:TIGR02391 family protein [Geodermatophilus sp. DSM 44513]|uniref:TIGR02391 family protein n=1 Tax=Geodermatophilus sp. DSM 44513 TaxID=1528104 RepID=UPI00126D0E04|nr:TIGR02391 family protein [Geodermatophilus sp. DSM 44513]WNV76519.1 TIGR02391 family protein [Geodermatophilus sp. DSM 44513]